MIKVGVDIDEEDITVINGVTIIADRYSGTYSGGKFTAWDMPLSEIPYDVVDNDCPCRDFWYSAEDALIGIGDTPQEAYEDLIKKKQSRSTMTEIEIRDLLDNLSATITETQKLFVSTLSKITGYVIDKKFEIAELQEKTTKSLLTELADEYDEWGERKFRDDEGFRNFCKRHGVDIKEDDED